MYPKRCKQGARLVAALSYVTLVTTPAAWMPDEPLGNRRCDARPWIVAPPIAMRCGGLD